MRKAFIICLFPLSIFAETKVFDAKVIQEIEISNSQGNIKLTEASSEKLHIKFDKKKFSKDCSLVIEASGDELEIISKSLKDNAKCVVDFEIQVPNKASVEIKQGSGNLSVEKIIAELEYNLGSGDSIINSDLIELEAKVGSGSIKATGAIGETDIEVGVGSVELIYTSNIKEREIEVKTGTGSVSIKLPKDSKVKSKASVGLGKITNQFENTSSFNNEIEVKVGVGNIQILK